MDIGAGAEEEREGGSEGCAGSGAERDWTAVHDASSGWLIMLL